MVPKYVTVTQMQTVVEYQYKTVTKKVTSYETVCVKSTEDYEYYVCEPKTMSKEEDYIELTPVMTSKDEEYTAYETKCVERKGTRKVTKYVTVKVPVKVTEDHGHWVTTCVPQTVVSHCGSCCNGCGTVRHTVMVPTCQWVSKPVTKTVDTYQCQAQTTDEPYTWYETVCTPVKKTRKIYHCSYKEEKKKRTVTWTEYHQKKMTGKRDVYRYECRPVTKDVTYQVCQPVHVQKPVQVTVCKMVPQTVTRTVCAPCGH